MWKTVDAMSTPRYLTKWVLFVWLLISCLDADISDARAADRDIKRQERDLTTNDADDIGDARDILSPMETDRVIFSEYKPTHIPASVQHQEIHKRSLQHTLLQSACESRSVWKITKTAKSIDGHPVILSRHFKGRKNIKQYTYVTECVSNGQHCNGFFETPSQSSECKEKSGWHAALVHSRGNKQKYWTYIAIPTCCTCAIVSLVTDILL